MKQKRDILSGISRSVAAAVLTVVVLFSLIPSGIRADDRFVIDPTGKREGLAAFLYDNKTGLPRAPTAMRASLSTKDRRYTARPARDSRISR